MAIVKVGKHYINTDAIEYVTEVPGTKDAVVVQFSSSQVRLSPEDWHTVLKAAQGAAAKEPDGVHAKLDILTKMMNPEEDY